MSRCGCEVAGICYHPAHTNFANQIGLYLGETDAWIKWLVEVLHYPFDMRFDPPPPVNLDQLADYWNEWDQWGITPQEARAFVRQEAGVE